MKGLRQQIAQMLLVGCRGATLSSDERLIFAEYAFGGFILFQNNCRAATQVLSLCRNLWDAAVKCRRLSPSTRRAAGCIDYRNRSRTFLPPRVWAPREMPELAYRAGKATADELRLTGINLDFAPVLDVNANPLNPVIGDRAFSADPTSVSAMSSAWSRGLRDGGIIPCGKHFPGHGDTDKDSHFDLPVVKKSLDELQSVDLPPFVEACRQGIEALMTAHVLYPALDSELPATLSEPIVTGLLRHQLGYDGVVFSDDMEMKAVSDRYAPDEAALLAVRAGVDVLLFCHDLTKAIQAFEQSLRRSGKRSGAARSGRVQQSAYRCTQASLFENI